MRQAFARVVPTEAVHSDLANAVVQPHRLRRLGGKGRAEETLTISGSKSKAERLNGDVPILFGSIVAVRGGAQRNGADPGRR